MMPLWKQRNFMLLWGGQFISYIGTQVSSIVLPLIVLSLTKSPAQAGIIAAIRGFIYVIVALPAGVLIDRWDKKVVMLIGNIGSGLAMMTIAIALLMHHLSLLQLYIVSIIDGFFFVFANLARFTSFVKVVTKDQYTAAISQWGIADNTALLIGPPIGGFLLQVLGAFMAFFVDALSYFGNVLLISFINIPLRTETPRERKAMHREIHEGILWLWNKPILRFLNLLFAGKTILASGLYLLIVVLAQEQHASSFTIGVIFACGAVGGIIGSFLSSQLENKFHLKKFITAVLFLSFVVFLFFFFATNVILLGLVVVLFYMLSPLFEIVIYSYTAKSIPEEIMARISSISRLLELGSYSFGFFITGILLEKLGSTFTIAIFSLLLFILFLATAINKHLESI